MERLKRGIAFWVLLFVGVALAVSGQAQVKTQVKKRLYAANIMNGGKGVGASVLNEAPSGYTVVARTFSAPDQQVYEAALRLSETDTRQILLCSNVDAVAEDCTYGADGNLDIEEAVNGQMLYLAGGITPIEFLNALYGGTLLIELNDGGLGSGAYVRIF